MSPTYWVYRFCFQKNDYFSFLQRVKILPFAWVCCLLVQTQVSCFFTDQFPVAGKTSPRLASPRYGRDKKGWESKSWEFTGKDSNYISRAKQITTCLFAPKLNPIHQTVKNSHFCETVAYFLKHFVSSGWQWQWHLTGNTFRCVFKFGHRYSAPYF